MYNPLVIFTGAALATLMALMGVTYDKWSPNPSTKTQPVVEEAAAPAADTTQPPAESQALDRSSSELASVVPEEGTPSTGTQETPLAKPDAAASAPDVSSAQPEAPADDSKPSFDTVRIEPDGSAVIAGRGQPDSHVTVMLDGEPIGSAKSDTGGAWVFIPEEPVPPGDHQLTLRMLADGAAAIYSDQSVALQVPDRAMGEALVVLSDPDQPSRVIQKPQAAEAQAEQEVAAAAQKQDARPGAGPMSLTLSTVDYNDAGDIIFSGTGRSDAAIRLYVDNAPVGDAAVAADGTWTFAGKEQITPGTHTLRVDQLHADGKVAHRIELPFVRAKPQQVAALNESAQPTTEPAGGQAAAPETPPASSQPEALSEEQPASAAAEAAPAPSSAPINEAEPGAVNAEASAAADEPPAPEPSAMEESQATDMAAVEASPAEQSTAQPAEQPPFVAPPAAEPAASAGATAAAPTIVMPRKGQIVIQPGNSLWRISRVIYGRGIEYTIIYDANKNQIRNPDLIYPGQIFATPGAEPPAMIDPANQTPLATTTVAPTSPE
ncbi:MAG: LysM peptidoglycan-binding domain-containing protein [Aestuariivirgaceae bacterium]